ncbi:hypothetical protein BpHYR1_010042 [Brachionus plicatilis]|uniref:Uncharacterized protein n=1 Tax=Brachionus plicatilis TaxID=10195 RepID=A0A3M7R934_BRAPC|nr:hypothetical protein BpHYR1_010042 [Brachionus plicatilis]
MDIKITHFDANLRKKNHKILFLCEQKNVALTECVCVRISDLFPATSPVAVVRIGDRNALGGLAARLQRGQLLATCVLHCGRSRRTKYKIVARVNVALESVDLTALGGRVHKIGQTGRRRAHRVQLARLRRQRTGYGGRGAGRDRRRLFAARLLLAGAHSHAQLFGVRQIHYGVRRNGRLHTLGPKGQIGLAAALLHWPARPAHTQQVVCGVTGRSEQGAAVSSMAFLSNRLFIWTGPLDEADEHTDESAAAAVVVGLAGCSESAKCKWSALRSSLTK